MLDRSCVSRDSAQHATPRLDIRLLSVAASALMSVRNLSWNPVVAMLTGHSWHAETPAAVRRGGPKEHAVVVVRRKRKPARVRGEGCCDGQREVLSSREQRDAQPRTDSRTLGVRRGSVLARCGRPQRCWPASVTQTVHVPLAIRAPLRRPTAKRA